MITCHVSLALALLLTNLFVREKYDEVTFVMSNQIKCFGLFDPYFFTEKFYVIQTAL